MDSPDKHMSYFTKRQREIVKQYDIKASDIHLMKDQAATDEQIDKALDRAYGVCKDIQVMKDKTAARVLNEAFGSNSSNAHTFGAWVKDATGSTIDTSDIDVSAVTGSPVAASNVGLGGLGGISSDARITQLEEEVNTLKTMIEEDRNKWKVVLDHMVDAK